MVISIIPKRERNIVRKLENVFIYGIRVSGLTKIYLGRRKMTKYRPGEKYSTCRVISDGVSWLPTLIRLRCGVIPLSDILERIPR